MGSSPRRAELWRPPRRGMAPILLGKWHCSDANFLKAPSPGAGGDGKVRPGGDDSPDANKAFAAAPSATNMCSRMVSPAAARSGPSQGHADGKGGRGDVGATAAVDNGVLRFCASFPRARSPLSPDISLTVTTSSAFPVAVLTPR